METIRQIIINKIREKKQDGICIILNEDNAKDLLFSMIDNLIKTGKVNKNPDNKGEVIFLEAPTGSGKDNIYIQLDYQNPEKNYIELNMDMFRKYYKLFLKDNEKLRDIDYSGRTNQFTYEIFIILQEVLIETFPGTNIVVSGTLRDIDWNKELMEYYKKHDYTVKLVTLAISKMEGLYSVIRRYLETISRKRKEVNFQKGTARFTSLDYFNETYVKFITNFQYFTDLYFAKPGELIDEIEVYRRNNSLEDFNDDNLVYSSSRDDGSPIDAIIKLRNTEYELSQEEYDSLVSLVKENYDYLKEQETIVEILWILPYLNDFKDYDKGHGLKLK